MIKGEAVIAASLEPAARKRKVMNKMDQVRFPIEFNNEVDDVKQSENELFTLAADRLSQLAEGHTDIAGAAVNFKQPAAGHVTPHLYEITIVAYMGTDHIAATEKGEHIRAALDGALDAIERQVRERRDKARSYTTS